MGVELSEAYADAVRDRLSTVMPEFGKPVVKKAVSVPRGPGLKRTRAAGLKPR
jgi:hypothetical protein